MAGTFQFGAVNSWKGYTFEDGDSSDKLLVVLGARQGQNIIGVLTTPQAHRRDAKPGCHANDGYYFIPAGSAGFPKDTWVELYRPQELSFAEAAKAFMSDDANVVSNLSVEIANAIRNCIKRTRDITPHQTSLLE